MVFTRYIHGYTWHGYTMYIHWPGSRYTSYHDINGYHTMYIKQVYIHPRIYMVYHLIYIHGIYMVYPWIFLAFWNQILLPASAAGLIQCAHLCGWSRGRQLLLLCSRCLSFSCCGQQLESWWKMGQREPSGQVTNAVSNSLEAFLGWKLRKR